MEALDNVTGLCNIYFEAMQSGEKIMTLNLFSNRGFVMVRKSQGTCFRVRKNAEVYLVFGKFRDKSDIF